MAEERLQKIIAAAGIASRREAEELIREGQVTVNGQVVRELGSKADPEHDHVKVRNKLITRPEPKRYILLNKPREVMTTSSDPEGRQTVIQMLKGVKERVFAVGRLDYQSEGLLILTNDGELANLLTHPKFGCEKTYHVKVKGLPEDSSLQKLRKGITIEGRKTRPCQIEKMRTTGKRHDPNNTWLEIRLREGRTQQIRKMFRLVGNPVQRLRRVAISSVEDPKLAYGEWRDLTDEEVARLRHSAADPGQKR
ncbi:MAG: rRNA pseudouridine synthase [Acidobacteria bacterium]|nr:rRNA pseudouridine synthase [Acidobacteriota bacterium]